LGHSQWYAYDDAGHLIRQVDGEWQATYYEYDGAGRRTAVIYGSTGGRVDFEYDAAGNRVAMTDTTGVTTYVYDALNRPLTVTSPLTGVVGYRYDAVGNRTRLLYPAPSAGSGQGGKVVTYTYDAANHLASVVDWAGQTTTYGYDAAGRLVTETLPNGVQTVSLYDDADRLTRLTHRRLSDGEMLGDYRFVLDAVGNRVTVTETLVVPTSTLPITTVIHYTYDRLNRLTGADYSNGYLFAYAYDAVGNRTAYTRTITDTRVTTYTYDAANRSTSVNGQAYTWDDNGNLLDDGSKTYTYDRAGRMVEARSVSVTLVYTYDADGLRVAQSVSDTVTCTVTAFTWDLASPLAQVLSTSDGALNLYGLARIGELRDGEWAYPLGDMLGSARQWTDESGAVTYAGGDTPFGIEIWSEGSTGGAWGYTGEWWDGYTDLLYLRARYYMPETGRFTQRDSWTGDLRRPQSLNGWTYVEGNPIKFADPLGLRGIIPWNLYYPYWGQSFFPGDSDIINDLGNTDNTMALKAIEKIEMNFEGNPDFEGRLPPAVVFVGALAGPCVGPLYNFEYPDDMLSYNTQPYYPDRNYNQYDWLISGWVDYWNWRARREGQSYTIDPNFIKAVAYKETGIGHYGGSGDYQGILQLGTEAKKALAEIGAGKVTWGPINVVDENNPSHNIGGGVRWLMYQYEAWGAANWLESYAYYSGFEGDADAYSIQQLKYLYEIGLDPDYYPPGPENTAPGLESIVDFYLFHPSILFP